MREHKKDLPVDRLPDRLPADVRRERIFTSSFSGLCTRDPLPYGIADMENMSPRRAPALAVRRPRELLAESASPATPHGLAVMNGWLYFWRGGELCRIAGGIGSAQDTDMVEVVGTLSDSDKRMAVFGEKLIILPDKQYVDAADGLLRPIELDSGEIDAVEFEGNTITLPWGMTWKELGFLAGDTVTVLNADDVTPAPEGAYCIKYAYGRVATLWQGFSSSYTSCARFKRVMPDMDGLCVSGNRLYGYKGKNLYVSAEGSAFCWSGTRTDGGGPAAFRTDTEGDITACASWQGYMVFFKADRLCKLLGSRTESFVLNDLSAPGIPAALSETLCEVGGDLYYHTDVGVYRLGYGRTYPERVGIPTVETPVAGCGGTDGVGYYISLMTKDSNGERATRNYLYMPESDIWYAEDGRTICGMAYREGFLCMQDADGRLWLCRSDGRRCGEGRTETDVLGEYRASVTFVPDHRYEPDGYRPIKLYVRASAEPGAEMRVVASYADGHFGRDADLTATDPDRTVELVHFEGGMTDRLLCIPLFASHCDGMVLRLEMTGEWEIFTVIREYEVRA